MLKRLSLVLFIFLLAVRVGTVPTTYYVSQSGNDSNSCATAASTTQANQKLTISAGVACLSAGDTLYIHTGTYTGTINSINSGATTVNGGTDFSTGVITIAAYPAETVTIAVGTGGGNAISLTSSTQKYIVFNRLILDGTGMGSFAGGFYAGAGVTHIKFQNGEIKNAPGQGANNTDTSVDIEILSSHVHHNGGNTTPHTHGIYFSGTGNLVEGCEIDHNAGNGVVLYNVSPVPDSNVIRKNFFHDNAVITENEVTIGGSNNQFYDNIVGGSGGGYALYVGFSTPTNTLVYNNTFVLSNGPQIASDATGTVFKNNIMRTTANAGAGSLTNGGSGTVQATNLTSSPTFTNGGGSYLVAGDFTLVAGSAAIDTGTTINTVVDDYAGTARPQGGSYDIGAYELAVSGSPAINTPGGGNISTSTGPGLPKRRP